LIDELKKLNVNGKKEKAAAESIKSERIGSKKKG
jgi:hypothetical protein